MNSQKLAFQTINPIFIGRYTAGSEKQMKAVTKEFLSDAPRGKVALKWNGNSKDKIGQSILFFWMLETYFTHQTLSVLCLFVQIANMHLMMGKQCAYALSQQNILFKYAQSL